MVSPLAILESEKFKQLSRAEQLRIRLDLRDTMIKSPKFKMLPAKDRAEALGIFGQFLTAPSKMENIENWLYESLGRAEFDPTSISHQFFRELGLGLPQGIGPPSQPTDRADVAASLLRMPETVVKTAVREVSLGLLDPEEMPLPEAIEHRLAVPRFLTQVAGALVPVIGASKVAGPIVKQGVKRHVIPKVLARPTHGALTLGMPSAISSGFDPGEMAKSAMVGALAGFVPSTKGIIGPLAAGGVMAAGEATIPRVGEAVGVPLGHVPAATDLLTVGLLPLVLHKPGKISAAEIDSKVKATSVPQPRTQFNVSMWGKGDVAPPRAVKQPETAPPKAEPPPRQPVPPSKAPTFKPGMMVEAADKSFRGNVEHTYWDAVRGIEITVARSPGGEVRRIAAARLQRPSGVPPPPEVPLSIPPSRRVDFLTGEDHIRRQRTAQERNDMPQTQGELRGLLWKERHMRDAIQMAEEIRSGVRNPIADFDATDAGLQQKRFDLDRIIRRKKTVFKFSGGVEGTAAYQQVDLQRPGKPQMKTASALSRKEVEEVLRERINPVYNSVRNVDGEVAADVQAARRHIEGTVKEPGAPLESAAKAVRPGEVDRPLYIDSDPDFVVYEDLRPTIPQRVKVPRYSRPLNQTILKPEALLLNPEIRIAMKQALKGQITPGVVNRLSFRVDWPSTSHIGFTLEQMGIAPKDHVRIQSIMARLVPGWNTTTTPGIEPLVTEVLPNPAAEKVASISTHPPGTPALITPETGDIGRISSAPTPETVNAIVKAEINARYHPLQPGPLGEGIYALNMRKINLLQGRINDLLAQLPELIGRSDGTGPEAATAGRQVGNIKTTIGELRGRIQMLHHANRVYGKRNPPEEVPDPDTSVRPIPPRDPKVAAQIRETLARAEAIRKESSPLHDEILRLESEDARDTQLRGPMGEVVNRTSNVRATRMERLEAMRQRQGQLKAEEDALRTEVLKLQDKARPIDWLPSNITEFEEWAKRAPNSELFGAYDHIVNEPFLYPKGAVRRQVQAPPIENATELLDTFEAHLRDLPVEEARVYLKDTSLDPAMRKRVRSIVAELQQSKAFTAAERKEFEKIEPATKWVHKTIEKVAVSDAEQLRLSQQLGVAGPEATVGKRGRALKVGTGFEIKEAVDRDAPPPGPPEALYTLKDKGPHEPGLKSFAENLGLGIEVTPEGYMVDGETVRTLKDVNALLRQYAALRNGESTVGAQQAKPPEYTPRTRPDVDFAAGERPPAPEVGRRPPAKGRPPPRVPEKRETRTPPGMELTPEGRLRTDMLNPRLVNAAAAQKGAEVARVDGGWMLYNYPEQTQRFYPEDANLSRNGWTKVVEALDELPGRGVPDLGPGAIGGQAPPRMPLARGPRPGGGPYPSSIPKKETSGLAPLAMYYRPTNPVMQLIQQNLKFPTYDKVFRPMEDARSSSDHWVRPWHRKARKAMRLVWPKEMDAVDDYIITPDKWKPATAARWKMQPRVLRAAKQLEGHWKDLLMNEMNMTEKGAKRFLQDYMPRSRKARGDIDVAWSDYNLPAELTHWGEYLRRGDVSLAGMNPLNNFNAMARMTAHMKFMEAPYQEARKVVNAKVPGTQNYAMPQHARSVVKSYLDTVRNLPHETVGMFDESLELAVKRLKLGKILPNETRHRIVNMLMSAHYGGTMWLRPALAIRNLMQSTLVIPEIGVQAWAHGLARAATLKGMQKAMTALKITPFGAGQGLPWEIQAYNKLSSAWSHAQTAGMYLYRGADTVNRSISYHAAEWAIQHYGKKLARGQISREAFLHKTGLIRQYEPARNHIMESIEGRAVPDLETAAREYGKQIVRNTQWMYRGGNEPMIFRGVFGKMLGQYGIWPVNFLEYMTRNGAGKTGSNYYQKAAFWGKLAATWTLMEKVWEDGFGVDATRATWINPFQFQGGPTFQLMTSIYKQAGGSEFERRMAKARMFRLLETYVPTHLARRDIIEALEETDDVRAFMRGIGFTPVDEDDANFLLEDVPEWAQGHLEDLADLIQ